MHDVHNILETRILLNTDLTASNILVSCSEGCEMEVHSIGCPSRLCSWSPSKLSFERHINEKIIKAKQGIGIIKYISKFFPLKNLDQMYKALVRSYLDYCDIIYHIPVLTSQTNLGVTLNSLMEKVERTQYPAMQLIEQTNQVRL